MRVSLIAISVAVLFTALPIWASAEQVIFVVRHGERLDSTSDSVLSAEGEARAIRLSTLLAATGLRTLWWSPLTFCEIMTVQRNNHMRSLHSRLGACNFVPG